MHANQNEYVSEEERGVGERRVGWGLLGWI